ncbi:MAG: non-ribosomal peptide synthetase, partial [bacterium]|nr:non-ribosomal peptide synthetase [bacterium]
LEYLGRIDQQVKIRGFRIEPAEIENHLLSYPHVENAVVVTAQKPGEQSKEQFLCAYIVIRDNFDLDTLKKEVSAQLPEYMIPTVFMKIQQVPLTPNGKLDRKALPLPEIASQKEYIAPRNPLEEQLADTWTEVLHMEKSSIGIDDGFFELGGHSLTITRLAAKIHKVFHTKIPLAHMFKIPSIRLMARYINNAVKQLHRAVEPVEKREYYSLSSAQKRIYILQKMDEESTGYNLPQVIPFQGELQHTRLEASFNQLIRRHESLRTSFALIAGQPVQIVHHKAPIAIQYTDINEATDSKGDTASTDRIAGIIDNFVKPFHLEQAPLLRVALVHTGPRDYLLLVDMHHIVSDGISQQILVNDFPALYEGTPLPPLPLQYKDYAQWQNQAMESEETNQQAAFWLNMYKGSIPSLNLPTDFPRPALLTVEGDNIDFESGAPLKEQVNRFLAEKDITLYMLLLGVFNILLSRYCNQEDIVVGSPVAGRTHDDLKHIMGIFVNMLPMRNHLRSSDTVDTFLTRVRQNALEAYDNQDYPFDSLIENLKIKADAGRHPLVETVFVLQNLAPNSPHPQAPHQMGTEPDKNETAAAPGIENRDSKFDLKLAAYETDENLCFNLEYRTALFKKETISQMKRHFLNLLKRVTESPSPGDGPTEKPLVEIDFFDEKEMPLLVDKIENAGESKSPTDDDVIEGDFDF